MNRLWVKVLLLIVIALALIPPMSACSSKTGEESNAPRRIVSLAPNNTEILFALGLGDRVVGVTNYCDYPSEAKTKPKIGGYSDVNLEKVIALSPDLVLASDNQKDTVVPELKGRGVNVIVIAPKTIDELLDNILQVGAITGKQAESAKLVNDMRTRIEAVVHKVSFLSVLPRVCYITWHDPLWTLGNGTLTSELIAKAGGMNIFADIDGDQTVDMETVIARNPQVILAGEEHGSGGDDPFHWAKTEERLKGVDARINNQVYEVDSNIVTRPGPRMADGLEFIAQCLYPEIFGKTGEAIR